MSKEHMLHYFAKGIKTNGVKLTDYRDIKIEYNVSETAEGSARVKIGDTEVIAGVKMGVEEPYADTPDSGNLMVGVELLPLSSPDFESGPPSGKAIELARVIDRGIREAKAIDSKKLCIKKGEKVWSVSVDICALNDAGNLLDAGALATLAALKVTRFPKYEDGEVDYREKSDKKIELRSEPIAITIYKIGEYFIVDPTLEEEKEYDARLTVTTTKDGTISAMQKGGDTALTIEEIDAMVGIGIEKAKSLRSAL